MDTANGQLVGRSRRPEMTLAAARDVASADSREARAPHFPANAAA